MRALSFPDIKRVKDEAAKATKAELKAITTAIKKAGKDSTKELGTAIDESLKSGNESARVAIQDLGEKMLEEDQEMFEKAKAHETELAKEVIKLVWEEGLKHSRRTRRCSKRQKRMRLS